MTTTILTTTSGVLTATAFGSMCFFAGVMAPLIFTRLPEETSGPFIRQVFPWYYLALFVLTGIAAALAGWHGDVLVAIVLGTVSLGFAVARQILMPRINRLRDRAAEGEAGAEQAFERSHRLSVRLNLTQLAARLAVLVHML